MMYELIQVADNTFYMDCPSKVGFYKTGTNEVIIIDSGNDKDAGNQKKTRTGEITDFSENTEQYLPIGNVILHSMQDLIM